MRTARVICFVTVLVAQALPASAVDMTQQIESLTGQAFAGADGKPTIVTLAKIAADALLMPLPDEKDLEAKQKVERYELAKRIVADPARVLLTAEETTLLKKLIGKGYSAAVVGPAWEMLDPPTRK
jgi:hypothetical protein